MEKEKKEVKKKSNGKRQGTTTKGKRQQNETERHKQANEQTGKRTNTQSNKKPDKIDKQKTKRNRHTNR